MKKTIIFLAITILFMNLVSGLTLEDGLISHYTMDATNYTDSEGFNNGTNSGTTIHPGLLGNAGLANANLEAVTFTQDWVTDGTNFTISLWINFTDVAGQGMSLIAQNPDKANGEWAVTIWGPGNVIRFTVFTGSTHDANFYEISYIPAIGTWEHLVFSFNATGDNFCLFRNATKTCDTTPTLASFNFGRGRAFFDVVIDDLDTWFTSAYFDEVAIWNRNLEDSEVTTLFNDGTPLPRADYISVLFIINSTLNMTSDGGCIAWRTDKTSICNTTTTTPTMVFDTNKNANCSMRTITHDYNSSFDCGTTGGTSHICTIFNVDALSFGLNNLIASCAGGGENDTTGNMVINLTVDSCTYTSGDWTIIDDCTIQSDTTVDALSDILVTGTVINNASITETGAFTNSGTFTNSGEGAVN